MALYGSQPFAGRKWAPQLKISEMKSVSEEFIIDPTLPSLGTDPRYPTSDQIVIPRGRIVAVRADSVSYTGKSVLTIADGKNNKPCGYAPYNLLRSWPEKTPQLPCVARADFIEVPYVANVNGAYGTLYGGDKITAYFGNITSTTANVPNNKGKIVKWVPKTLYTKNQSLATTITLSNAVYPGMTPSIVQAWANTTVVTTGAVSMAFNGTAWVATFGQTVTDVSYTSGQEVDQIAGEVVRNEPISASHNLGGWLEWVQDNFLAMEYPPQLMRVPTTDVSNEVPTSLGSGQYQLANKPVAPWKTLTVTVTGTLTAPDGTQTSLSGTALSVSDVPWVDYTLGTYYDVNPITGVLTIAGNISVTAVTVSYSYETSYRSGRLWNAGQIGLTDGYYTGVPGTPANLELSGTVGSLRVIIY